MKNYKFKSRTAEGFTAHYHVLVYEDQDVIAVRKVVLSEEGRAKGWHVVRRFKNLWMLEQTIAFKRSSLFNIMRIVFDETFKPDKVCANTRTKN